MGLILASWAQYKALKFVGVNYGLGLVVSLQVNEAFFAGETIGDEYFQNRLNFRFAKRVFEKKKY